MGFANMVNAHLGIKDVEETQHLPAPAEIADAVLVPEIVVVDPLGVGQDDPVKYYEAAKDTMRERFSEDELLKLLLRMQKASTFMLEHLYDERGKAKLDDFVAVSERLHGQLVAFRTVRLLST